VETTKAFAS